MELRNLGGCRSIDEYVRGKLERFGQTAKDFASLFEFMFSEKDNIQFEESAGYQIRKATYGEVQERVRLRAATLKEKLREIPAGSIVGLCGENSQDWIEMLWAILMTGHSPLLMNTRLDDRQLNDTLAASGAKAVLCAGERTFCVPTLRIGDIPCAEKAYVPDAWGQEILVMTSGTSAHVKICAYGAAQFAEQIASSARIITECAQIKKHVDGELKQLAFLPFYHIFGLVAVYIWFGFFSRTFVLLKDFAPQTILNTIRQHRVTHVFAVPVLWERTRDEVLRQVKARGEKTQKKFEKGLKLSDTLAKIPGIGPALCRRLFRELRENLFGDSVVFTISGGSFIRPETLRLFNAMGYYLCNGYGMSEIGITSVELSPKAERRNSASVGTPIGSLEYRAGEGGVLEVRGTSMARRILEDGTWRETGGWFRTGDLAEEKDGHWFLLGRSDDLVIGAEGENWNPNLLEPRLRVSEQAEVCLIGGEGLVPTLICAAPETVGEEQLEALREKTAARLAEMGLSSQIRQLVVTTAPLCGPEEFKVSRRAVRDRFLRGEIADCRQKKAASAGETDELTGKIIALIAEVLGKEAGEVRPDSDFFTELGGTSLDYLALAGKLQTAFGNLPETDAQQLPTTPAALAACFREAGLC